MQAILELPVVSLAEQPIYNFIKAKQGWHSVSTQRILTYFRYSYKAATIVNFLHSMFRKGLIYYECGRGWHTGNGDIY